jgi:hypothetical protein
MAKKTVDQQVQAALKAAISSSDLYRHLAERLATGRWYSVDWTGGRDAVERDLKAAVGEKDDYVIVNPAVYAAVRTIKGYVHADVNDDMIGNNVYGWLDSGVEVRVYPRLPANRMVVGENPLPVPDRRTKRTQIPMPVTTD